MRKTVSDKKVTKMRAIWSGSLNFGLINIPVQLASASKENVLKFHLLDKHGNCPISYARVCRTTGKEVPYKDIVKGYEYEEGDYVVLYDEDFKKAFPRKTHSIDIVSFTDDNEIEPEFYEKPYFVEPDKKAEKAYVLLRDALKKSGKMGIGKFILRDREHICAIRAEGKAIMLIQLRYEDELRLPKGINLPAEADYSKKEMDIALMLIDQLSSHFEAEEFKDTYTEKLEKVIEEKAKGKPIHVQEEKEASPKHMKNLMSMLKKSLQKVKHAH